MKSENFSGQEFIKKLYGITEGNFPFMDSDIYENEAKEGTLGSVVESYHTGYGLRVQITAV